MFPERNHVFSDFMSPSLISYVMQIRVYYKNSKLCASYMIWVLVTWTRWTRGGVREKTYLSFLTCLCQTYAIEDINKCTTMSHSQWPSISCTKLKEKNNYFCPFLLHLTRWRNKIPPLWNLFILGQYSVGLRRYFVGLRSWDFLWYLSPPKNESLDHPANQRHFTSWWLTFVTHLDDHISSIIFIQREFI